VKRTGFVRGASLLPRWSSVSAWSVVVVVGTSATAVEGAATALFSSSSSSSAVCDGARFLSFGFVAAGFFFDDGGADRGAG
jgi:hypothetical protein